MYFSWLYPNRKLDKFDSQECVMLRYSKWSKDYKESNIETNIKMNQFVFSFDDELGSEKVKASWKFGRLKSCMSDSEGKESEERDSKNCWMHKYSESGADIILVNTKDHWAEL